MQNFKRGTSCSPLFYKEKSMTVSKYLSLHKNALVGKAVAVSGSTGGIGKELCRHLATLGADLVLIDRSIARSQALGDSLKEEFPDISITYVTADMEDMQAVKNAVGRLKELSPDHLILNAGAYHIPRYKCDTGFDNVFQINFVSPYYIARRLLEQISARGGKIVAVGSIAHNYSHIDPADVDFSTRGKSSKVYGNAKRYLMFALLGQTSHSENIRIVHPGITFTNITAHYPRLIFAIIKHPMKIIFMKPKKAALCVLDGLFSTYRDSSWVGPLLFSVWGAPKTQVLRTCPHDEIEKIHSIAQDIYNKL